MAVWSFLIELLPQEWLDAGGAVGTLFGDRGYDTSAAWENWEAGDTESIQSRISSTLPLVESWNGSPWSQLSWGNHETNDTENGMQLIAQNGRIAKLSARWDMRRPNLPIFSLVVSVARDLRLAILDIERQRIVPPDVKALLWAAATCRAAWFLEDRSSFLTSLHGGNGHAT